MLKWFYPLRTSIYAKVIATNVTRMILFVKNSQSKDKQNHAHRSELAMIALILPNVSHVLKTCKASFSNWYLQLNNERGCLSLFYTLRNRADLNVRKNVLSEKSYLKSNDYVRNRDRQNPSDVLALCNPALLA